MVGEAVEKCRSGQLAGLRGLIGWAPAAVWNEAKTNTDHEEQAAIICILTAACVAVGKYVAVGDHANGWFFLPPRACWAPWAWSTLDVVRATTNVRVWLDGCEFGTDKPLPT